MKISKLIKLDRVSKIFRVKSEDVLVLKDISLEINKGEFMVIFGPSGCGKSTLLHVIQGLETPTSGSVNFLEQDLYSLSEDEKAELRKQNLGIVLQQPHWIKSLNVIENIAFPAQLLGEKKKSSLEKAKLLLEEVKMLEWAYYNPNELSSGQQQKIALARALVTDPDIIITDEPTGNLDFNSSTEFMRLLQRLNKFGKTIILVTHDIANLAYSKKIVQMLDGQIVKIFDKTEEGVDLLNDVLISTNNAIQINQSNQQRNVLKHDVSIRNLLKLRFINPKHIPAAIVSFFEYLLYSFYISLKLFIFLIYKILSIFKLNGAVEAFFHYIEGLKSKQSISTLYLMDISFKNMFVKKARAAVTVGGMMIGIAIIVLLLSIGYGLEKLVISRVSKLEETKQIEVSSIPSTNLKITEETLIKIKNIPNVEETLPVVGLVGKVNYQNSNIDIAVYGVQSNYLIKSALKPTNGTIFKSNELGKQIEIKAVTPTPTPSEEIDIEKLLLEQEEVEQVRKVELTNGGEREVVVNNSLLQTLGLTENNAIDKSFDISFTVTGDLVDNKEKVESNPITYKIIGVLNDNQSPLAYIPITHTKELGIQNYSQLKVVINSEENVDQVRKQVQTLGFKTESIIDTITQIEQLFKNVRLILGIIGIVALTIASFGIFNTLTVSLLERTKEVGLMKAIGMQSKEVRDLFISESLTISLLGGMGGLLLGYLLGKGLSALLSIIFKAKEIGFIDITYIPGQLILLILLLTLFVGVITGIYPAKRAKRITPLEAMRYE